jgi:hypothetical protein
MNKRVFLLLSFLISLILCSSFVLAKDLNKDGTVDVLDLSIVARAFGSKPGDTNWNQAADLNNDWIINIADLTIVANNIKEISSKTQPSGTSSTFPLSISNIISWVKNLFIKPTAVQSSAKTIVYVDPKRIVDHSLTRDETETFTIAVNVYNVYDLYSFEVYLLYNPNILQYKEHEIPKFLNEEINPIFPIFNTGDGWTSVGATSLGPVRGVDGSGTLAYITFQVIGEGETILDNPPYQYGKGQVTTLVDQTASAIKNVICEDGSFNNYAGMKIQYSIMRPSSGTIVY